MEKVAGDAIHSIASCRTCRKQDIRSGRIGSPEKRSSPIQLPLQKAENNRDRCQKEEHNIKIKFI